MANEPDIATLDQLIHRTRDKFRQLAAANPDLFGGEGNARIPHTINSNAALGTIAVPNGIDSETTQGLMHTVDLTLLDPQASNEQIEAIAARGMQENTAAICVYPQHVASVQNITGGNPPPIAVVGFPSVADPVSAFAETLKETRRAIRDGAKEIDMVLPMNFKDGNPDYAAHYRYLREVVAEAEKTNVPVKVILETSYLTDVQKIEASMLAKMAGATFVKTSTGFAQVEGMRPEIPATQTGATAHDIALMRRTVGDTTLDSNGREIPMGVKASGGLRTRAQAIEMCEAGASRIGASGSIDVRTIAEKQVTDRRATSASAERVGGY